MKAEDILREMVRIHELIEPHKKRIAELSDLWYDLDMSTEEQERLFSEMER